MMLKSVSKYIPDVSELHIGGYICNAFEVDVIGSNALSTGSRIDACSSGELEDFISDHLAFSITKKLGCSLPTERISKSKTS